MIILAVGMVVAWALSALYDLAFGEPSSPLKLLSLTATVLGGALVFLADWLWPQLWRRFPFVQRKLFPDLNGVWKGELISTWVNPETNERVPPISTTITIQQTLFSTNVSLQTGESHSHSTRSFLERFPETSRFRIWYSYNNEPQAQFQQRSSPHEGVAFLELRADMSLNHLAGRYYTARKTTGDIDVQRI